MVNTAEIPSQPLKKGTNFLSSDYKVDTDIRRFADTTPREPFPSKRRTIRLYMPQEAEPLVLIDIEHLRIGRAPGENRLDLSLQYAKMLGVSREHADISYREGDYYITDLGSTNGTFLNNRKLQPNQPYQVQHSDQVRLGHFMLLIGFS